MMLKLLSEGLMSCLKTLVKPSSIGWNAQFVSHRFFSQNQIIFKKYSVKDHNEFDQLVINSDHPVIVDFHAEWCEPCNILTPILKALLEKSDEIDLAIVDVEANTDLVETFGVKAVPAVLAFCNGVIVDKFIGLVDNKRLESLIGNLNRNNLRQRQSVSQ